MPNNISVAVAADVTDLQVKFAVAKAETSALTTEMNKLARQSAAGIIDPAGEAALQQVAGELIKARAEAASLGAEFKEMTQQTVSVGGSLEEMGGKLNAAFQAAGITAAVEAVHMVTEAVERFGDRATQIHSMSDILDVTTSQFQAMEAAAEEGGVGMEVFARAGEKLSTLLFEARDNSGAAIEKLRELGLTTQQVNDPTFKLNETLGVLRDRLLDPATALETHNRLLKEFGSRTAQAIEAIKQYDGSESGVAETMKRLNGLSTEQVGLMHEMGVGLQELDTWAGNAAAKMGLLAKALLPTTTGTNAGSKLAEQERIEDQSTARLHEDLQRTMLQQEMDNVKAGTAAFKEGSQQKLEALREYARLAQQYYGSDTVDAVVKANQAIIAEQRAVTQAATESAEKGERAYIAASERVVADKLAAVAKEIAADDAYLTQFEQNMAGLTEFAERNYTEQTLRKAAGLKEMAALDARGAKEEVSAWKGVVGEIEGAEGSMVSNILSKRKSLSQSLVQMGADLAEKEIANDLRAVTTRLLFQTSAANTQKALEQGGLLYHEAIELLKTLHVKTNQTAQTGAVASGNAARDAATASAAAAAQATAAATGAPMVMADAAKAYAGTFASVAQIPYVGYIMAPAAAEASFAAVAAYAGMASLDTGTNYVPQDQLAQIHKGEAVVPKQFNPAANPFAMAGGGHSEEHNYNGDVNVHALDSQSLARAMRRGGRGVAAGALHAYRRGFRG